MSGWYVLQITYAAESKQVKEKKTITAQPLSLFCHEAFLLPTGSILKLRAYWGKASNANEIYATFDSIHGKCNLGLSPLRHDSRKRGCVLSKSGYPMTLI